MHDGTAAGALTARFVQRMQSAACWATEARAEQARRLLGGASCSSPSQQPAALAGREHGSSSAAVALIGCSDALICEGTASGGPAPEWGH